MEYGLNKKIRTSKMANILAFRVPILSILDISSILGSFAGPGTESTHFVA